MFSTATSQRSSWRARDWERWQQLRADLVVGHRGPILDALAAGKHPGHVELLAATCASSKQLAKALRAAFRGPTPAKLAGAVAYASRRFVDEPSVVAALVRAARPFAVTAARGEWKQGGALAWRALYVTDTAAGADLLATMIDNLHIYTNHPPKQRTFRNTAARVRTHPQRKRCRAAVMNALDDSWVIAPVVQAAVAIGGVAVRRKLEARWREYGEYTDSDHASIALGGLLGIAPGVRAYHTAANRCVPAFLAKNKRPVVDDVLVVDGIVAGIERGKIRALRPLVAKIAKWKFTPNDYADPSAMQINAATAVMKRRIARVLA